MRIKYVAPLGTLQIAAQDGCITELYFMGGFVTPPDFDEGNHSEAKPEDEAVLKECTRQLDSYFAGTLKEFNLPLNAVGTPFRMKVWEALQGIPYGETISYKELAVRIGNPKAVRAVGGANHHNPINIIIPCHRVIGAGGQLTGYGGGMGNKEFLLGLERKST